MEREEGCGGVAGDGHAVRGTAEGDVQAAAVMRDELLPHAAEAGEEGVRLRRRRAAVPVAGGVAADADRWRRRVREARERCRGDEFPAHAERVADWGPCDEGSQGAP